MSISLRAMNKKKNYLLQTYCPDGAWVTKRIVFSIPLLLSGGLGHPPWWSATVAIPNNHNLKNFKAYVKAKCHSVVAFCFYICLKIF